MTWWSVLIALVLVAQQTPVRDPGTPSASGTGVIRGIVVDEISGAPIAGARVTAGQRGVDERNPGAFSLEVTAGGDGRFELIGLPAGPIVIGANAGERRSTHLAQIVGHDGGMPYLGVPSLELGPGEVRSNLRIALKRAAAVEGFVVDEFGEPMAGVTVTANAVGASTGGGMSGSDDRGWFRLFGLRPGTYKVCGEAQRGWSPAIPGNFVDDVRTRYDRSCGPDVRVSVDEVPTVQLQMQRVGSYTLSGRVISGAGDVSRAHVMVMHVTDDGSRRSVNVQTKDGEFSARGLLPGEYALIATLPDPDAHEPFVGTEAGVSSVRIDASDVTGVTLAMRPTATVRGRIVRDPRATGRIPSALRATALPALSSIYTSAPSPPSTMVSQDGAFELRGLIGTRTIDVTGLTGGWFVASVRQGDDDIRARVRDFTTDDRPVVIVLSDRTAEVRARPIDEDGKPQTTSVVVAVPSDRSRWDVMPLGRMPVWDPDGYQHLTGLAPGEYFLAAIPASTMRTWWPRATSLEALARVGRRVTLVEGEPLVIDLPVARLEDLR
jgi:hypothetical protein